MLDLTKTQFNEMRSNNKVDAYWGQAFLSEIGLAATEVVTGLCASTVFFAARGDAQTASEEPPEVQTVAVAVDDACSGIASAGLMTSAAIEYGSRR